MSGPLSRVWGRMQRPLRESKAPHMRALAAAMSRGTQMLSLSSLVRGLYLETARGRWLDAWADVLALGRGAGERDGEFRARILDETLTRGDTRLPAVERAASAAAGTRVTAHASLPFVARYDNLEALLEHGNFMADFERIAQTIYDLTGRWGTDPWGDTPWGAAPKAPTYAFDDTPFSHLGYPGRTPLRPGWGSAGAVLVLGEEYDEATEARVLAAAEDAMPAAGGYDLFWSHTFRNELSDTVVITDTDFTPNPSGYGIDEWGDSTWG